ncbi:MAG: 4Fe-4S dicluster domain-containing protein [Chloroflexota bacterium]|nr:4Fe-4S dicluster domain-containing protein [Chloroflexota bacterium]
MARRGTTRKHVSEQEITLERAMVTRHYVMTWDLERCVGCQLGPLVCPKDAVTHVAGEIEDGRLAKKPAVDIDADACVLCGICEVVCPKSAITLTINGERENPVLVHEAFPEVIESTIFHEDRFDWSRKDFVIDNCPTNVISFEEQEETLVVDDEHCIRCRQCEVASEGAFQVAQPWQGQVELRRERCVEDCLACADICPTRALHIDEDSGELTLADYYCIKCGACMQVCPIKPEYEEREVSVESHGVTKTVTHRQVTNRDELPIWVERWRLRHHPVQSAAWIEALTKMADDRAGMIEMDRKRALRRHDLLKALAGAQAFLDLEE